MRLQEVDQQPPISIRIIQVPKLIKINKFFGQYLQEDCYRNPLESLYPCHPTIETEEQ